VSNKRINSTPVSYTCPIALGRELCATRWTDGGQRLRLIPLARLRVRTWLSPRQIVTAFRCRIRPGGSYLTWEAEPSFRGRINESHFALRRSISYQNAFMPLAVGKVTSADDGSDVEVTLRPFWPVVVLVSVWCVCAIAIGVLEFAGLTAGGSRDGRVGLLALAGALAGYLILLAGFWVEAGRTEAALREVLEQTPDRWAQSNKRIQQNAAR
jgi:hypothetical protein